MKRRSRRRKGRAASTEGPPGGSGGGGDQGDVRGCGGLKVSDKGLYHCSGEMLALSSHHCCVLSYKASLAAYLGPEGMLYMKL